MNEDLYSWCNVQHMDRLIKKERLAFKEKEIQEELKEEEQCQRLNRSIV